MYDLLDLKLIQYIREETSLSAVAARARMSLPAVSQRLAKLEDHFGEKLVNRSGRFGLTPAGQILFHAASNINAEVVAAENGVKALRTRNAGNLRIACLDSTLIDDLPAVLERLAAETPDLQISIIDVPSSQLAEQLWDGVIDVALVSSTTPFQGLELTAYKSERACIVAPLSHPLSQSIKAVLLEEALSYDLVIVDHRSRYQEQLDTALRNAIRQPRIRARVQSVEALCMLVAQTQLGIGLTFETAARRHARIQPIHVIRLSDSWATRTLQTLSRPLHQTSATTQKFVRLLTDQFSQVGDQSIQKSQKT